MGQGRSVQGNLDPAICLAPWPVVEEATRAVLSAASASAPDPASARVAPDRDGGSESAGGHVFNLGHGVLPETDPGILRAVADLVHHETARP